jgi:hypothetical protein
MLKFAVFLAVIVGIGIGIGWLATRNPSTTSAPPPAPASDDNALNSGSAAKPAGAAGPGQSAAKSGQPAAKPADSGLMLVNWEDQIGDILATDGDPSNKCANLLELFPKLPEDGQVEAAHHLSNLASDDNYAPLAKILTDPTTSSNVDDVLLMDVMNRPGSLKLPVLLEVARTPNHPEAQEALSKLGLLLDADLGTDWYKWQAKIDDYLTNNPD